MPAAEKITQEKIIRALLDASFKKSEGATSLSDISEILGIKKASLYNHYENRDAIVDDTIRWCGGYMEKLSFIPADMDSTAQKYPAETVLKGLASRWLKMHEKDPLIKIYSFIESEKYFSNAAKDVVAAMRTKLQEQSATALKSLSDAKKIRDLNDAEIEANAQIFAESFREALDFFIVERKAKMLQNPGNWEGSLVSNITESEEDTTAFDKLVENFVHNLNRV